MSHRRPAMVGWREESMRAILERITSSNRFKFAGARRSDTVLICSAVEPCSPAKRKPAQPPQLAPVAG